MSVGPTAAAVVKIRLMAIGRDGSPAGEVDLGEHAGMLQVTASFYASVGFEPPWVSYVALEDDRAVGLCSFKSSPVSGRVEIAYFTFPAHEGRGVATAMVKQLVDIAHSHRPDVLVTAQTLPERNASHSVLAKSGFRARGTLVHPEDGTVLEWELPADSAAAQPERNSKQR